MSESNNREKWTPDPRIDETAPEPADGAKWQILIRHDADLAEVRAEIRRHLDEIDAAERDGLAELAAG